MAFIDEDDIEKTLLSRLSKDPFNYSIIKCSPSPDKKDDLNDGTFRTDKKQCVLPNVLHKKLKQLNPNIPDDILEKYYKELIKDYTNYDLTATNYKLYSRIRNNREFCFRKNGKNTFDFVSLIDFKNPENNEFTAVSQMWVKGRYYYHRPDVLIFVNGLPLIFIELKNSTVKIKEAYSKNLKKYLSDCPNLFAFNQICVLSNGLHTKLGAYNAEYGFFFEWLKEKEEDAIDRKLIEQDGLSIEYFINYFLKKEILLDYIENFIIYENESGKIIAKNHQYLGVNNLIENTKNRKELKGKLGVFWHTQGSGKSYSMIFYVRKVKRKLTGNYTFLIVTDREELDNQIHKYFVRTNIIGPKDETQPKNSSQLREFLSSTSKPYLFTMIHKFRYDKNKKYPILSTRDDIIVLVDEAHRTQYKDLAENMRSGLPNANFVAFTGTPLLGSKRLTNQWFGDYVSEYNFGDSVEDGSTVPLFYSQRVPEVSLNNDFLDDDVLDIVEKENLTDVEIKRLENSSSKIIEVIKRDSRLDKIAQDIAKHFPRRGYLGKAMVVSVDKFTAVKMYQKVKHYFEDEKRNMTLERNNAATKEERDRLTKILDYMNTTEMAVVVSEDAEEMEKFASQGIDFHPFRERMKKIDEEGRDIEDVFRDPETNLRLVFVCAMWLTGFDVPCLSTLYLDKPMKDHTLMQAIARCNRIDGDKQCGIIIDYINIFKYMKKALKDYAQSDGKEMPIKNIEELVEKLDAAITETDTFLKSIGISLDEIISTDDAFERLDKQERGLDSLFTKDEWKEKFKVLSNTVIALYEASKPEIFKMDWDNSKFDAIKYLHGLFNNQIRDEKLERAMQKMRDILDNSVQTNEIENTSEEKTFQSDKFIDLSKLNLDDVKKRYLESPYKGLCFNDIREYIETCLIQMINRNQSRRSFAERFKRVIDEYNSGSNSAEEFIEKLSEYLKELQEEDKRADREGLNEAELEIYDLLCSGKKLTKEEEKKVKLASKNLYNKLKENREKLLIVDWYKDDQPYNRVKSSVADSLNEDLPESYDKEIFETKTDLIVSLLIDKTIQGIQIFY